MSFLLIFVFFIVCGEKAFQVQGDEQEYRLIRYLMSNYDPAVRPSYNATMPLRVTFDLSLHQVINLDERNHILTTNCWLTQKWTDVHLKWNSSDFSGISVVRIPAAQVWRPDIILYNNADSQYSSSVVNTNVIIRSSGEVTWLSHGIFKSSCTVDVEFFPFDVQTCHMKFASWTHDIFQVELKKERDQPNLLNYLPNGEFDLDSFSSIEHVEKYPCCEELYPDITFVLVLRRRPLFYIFNLILPCFLINLISVFTFYVPSQSGEKVTLGISCLLSVIVFLMVVRDSLPPTHKTPLISIYYAVTICLVSSATFFSIVTLNVHHRGSRGNEVPRCLKRFILGCLARIFLVSHPHKKKQKGQKVRKAHSEEAPHRGEKVELDYIEHYTVSPRLRHRKEMAHSLGSEPSSDEFEKQFLRVLHRVHETMERNEMRIAEQERKDAIRGEWEQVAMVCDRMLLAIFIIATATSTFLLLSSSPHGP